MNLIDFSLSAAVINVGLYNNAPEKRKYVKNHYVLNAVDKIIRIIHNSDLSRNDFQIALVGGANVIPNNQHRIGESNIKSIKDYLQENNLSSKFESLGGKLRRFYRLGIENGMLNVTIGNELQAISFRF